MLHACIIELKNNFWLVYAVRKKNIWGFSLRRKKSPKQIISLPPPPACSPDTHIIIKWLLQEKPGEDATLCTSVICRKIAFSQ